MINLVVEKSERSETKRNSGSISGVVKVKVQLEPVSGDITPISTSLFDSCLGVSVSECRMRYGDGCIGWTLGFSSNLIDESVLLLPTDLKASMSVESICFS